MDEESGQQWHRVLSERNTLRISLETLIDAQRRYHDDHHVGATRWCAAEPCRLLVQLQ
ncbi:hypothetical protein ACIBEH_32740 [Nocardia salmonicida]|uniref:hypothetical protein n=1 Tax=Nocardia salmonicida TaxID=53431 RepID=UPI0037A32689